MAEMKDWIGQIAMNIVAAVVLAVFVMWFGIPNNTTVATFGAIYIAFALLTMFTRMPIDKIGLNKQVTIRYLLCSIGVFPVCFLLLRNGCSWDIEKAYAVVILLLYIGLVAVSIQSNTRTTSKLQTGFIGHAAMAVCFRNDGPRLLTFLILNKNHDMWLLPGGHLDIAHDDPSVVAKHRILSELGYDSRVVELDNIKTKIFQSAEILRGCHAFYRIVMGPYKCHEIHLMKKIHKKKSKAKILSMLEHKRLLDSLIKMVMKKILSLKFMIQGQMKTVDISIQILLIIG